MTTKITYISYDGEEFETAEDCKSHEEKIAGQKGIVFFDHSHEQIESNDPVSKYELAYYLYILDRKQAEGYFDWLYDYAGYEFENDYKDGQIFIFNERTHEYEDLNGKIENLVKIKNDILRQVKEMEKENG